MDGMYLAAAGVSESTQAPSTVICFTSPPIQVSPGIHPVLSGLQNWTALASFCADGSKLAAVSSLSKLYFHLG